MQSSSQEVVRTTFKINLNDDRLRLVHALAKFLVNELSKPMTLDTRPLGENDDNDVPTASKWTTVVAHDADHSDRWQNVSVSIDMRFRDCNASTIEEFDLRRCRGQISRAMDVLQIQKFIGLGGIWSIDARVPKDIAVLGEDDWRVEMRILASAREDTKGGRRMV